MNPRYSFTVDDAFALADELESARQRLIALERPHTRERVLPIVCSLEGVYGRVDELAALTFRRTPGANVDAVTDAAILLQKQKKATELLVLRVLENAGGD